MDHTLSVMLLYQSGHLSDNSDVIRMLFCPSTTHNSGLFPCCYGNRYVVISLMIRKEHGIQCMSCSSRIINERLPEIHTMVKCEFLRSIIHSQVI